MITYSIIQKSQLENAHRMDAEYFQPEYLKWQNLLIRSKSAILKDIAIITTGTAYSSEEIGEDGEIPLARIGDVVNKIEIDDWLKVSKKEFEKFGGRKIKDLDILLSMTGDPPDVGKCNLISIEDSGALAFNQRVAKLTSRINPHYLFAFLSTEIARSQMERNALGIRQRNLGINDLRNTLIFVPRTTREQEIIGDLIISYLEKLKNSKSLYSQAENLLLEELGLKDFEEETELWSIVSLSDVKKANRIDADYFNPKYKQIQKVLKGAKYLSEITERITKKVVIKPKNEYNYIEISDVNAGTGEGSSNKILGQGLPANAKIKIDGGELIVSKVRPTRGAIAIIPDDWNKDFILSGAFSAFKIESPMREYLQVLLRSFVGKLQLEKPTTGTSYPTVIDQDIENILVPIPPKPIQQKIAELVKQSHESRKNAKELLEEAKHKVENMIENQVQ